MRTPERIPRPMPLLYAVVVSVIIGSAPASALFVTRGTDVSEGDDYRFQVALFNRDAQSGKQSFFCGGTLLSETWVLTAAHCTLDDAGADRELRIYAGSYDFRNGEWINVERIMRHPLYDRSSHVNDLALLKLNHSPDKELSTSIISLVDKDADLKLIGSGKSEVTILGWGSISSNGADWSRVLQKAPLNLVDRRACNKTIISQIITRSLMNDFVRLPQETGERLADSIADDVEQKSAPLVTDRMICAGDMSASTSGAIGRGPCFGDSGGPIFLTENGKHIQIGVTSWRVPPCGSVGVFVRLAQENIADWIRSAMSASEPEMPPAAPPPTGQEQTTASKRAGTGTGAAARGDRR